MTASEQDMRVEILNTLLTTPHRAGEGLARAPGTDR